MDFGFLKDIKFFFALLENHAITCFDVLLNCNIQVVYFDEWVLKKKVYCIYRIGQLLTISHVMYLSVNRVSFQQFAFLLHPNRSETFPQFNPDQSVVHNIANWRPNEYERKVSKPP